MSKFYIVGRKSFEAYTSIQKKFSDDHKRFLTVSLDKLPVAKSEKGKWSFQAWIGSDDIADIMNRHNLDPSVVATLYSKGKLSRGLIPDAGILTVEEWSNRLESLPGSFCLIDDKYREFDIQSVLDDWSRFKDKPSLNMSSDERLELSKALKSMEGNSPYNLWTTVEYKIDPKHTLRNIDFSLNPKVSYVDDTWGMAEFSTLLMN